MSIRINPEFKALIPPLSPEEFKQLEENCVRDGIRDALVCWHVPNGDDILIDGHNRWQIAARHGGIPFEIKRMEFESYEAVKAWIIRNQLGRRNIDKWIRFDLTKQLAEIEAKQAKIRMSDGAKGTPILAEAKGETRDKMAKMVGVSHGTYDKMKYIDQHAPENVKEKARSGEMSINQAYNETKAKEARKFPTASEYQQIVKDRHEAVKESKTVSMDDLRQDKRDKELLGNNAKLAILKAVKQINELYVLITAKEIDIALMPEYAVTIALRNINEAIDRLEEIKEKIERK